MPKDPSPKPGGVRYLLFEKEKPKAMIAMAEKQPSREEGAVLSQDSRATSNIGPARRPIPA